MKGFAGVTKAVFYLVVNAAVLNIAALLDDPVQTTNLIYIMYVNYSQTPSIVTGYILYVALSALLPSFSRYDDLRTELSIYGREHMITPNFERLAKKSVVFDYAFCQVAVCNPSRDSMLTGLRPDSIGVYGFQASFRPHMVWPSQLARSGFNTAGYGKVLHWDGNDKDIWSYDQYENDWYGYQSTETCCRAAELCWSLRQLRTTHGRTAELRTPHTVVNELFALL